MAHDPASLGDLTALLGSTSATAVSIPSADSLVHALAARYRLDLTSTYCGSSTLVSLNPNEAKADVSEASKAEYEERAYRRRTSAGGDAVHPHPYDLACRVYYTLRRTGESQSIVYRCATLPSTRRTSPSRAREPPTLTSRARTSQRCVRRRSIESAAARHRTAAPPVDLGQERHAHRRASPGPPDAPHLVWLGKVGHQPQRDPLLVSHRAPRCGFGPARWRQGPRVRPRPHPLRQARQGGAHLPRLLPARRRRDSRGA